MDRFRFQRAFNCENEIMESEVLLEQVSVIAFLRKDPAKKTHFSSLFLLKFSSSCNEPLWHGVAHVLNELCALPWKECGQDSDTLFKSGGLASQGRP